MRVATFVKVLLASTTAWALASQCQAQSAQTANNSATPDSLEEVVVTATKRAQSISQIPASISAVSAADLEAKGQRDLSDLGGTVPGLQVAPDNTDISITLRGVGHSLYSPAAENSVALHLDGVYLSRPADAQMAFFDVDRVEVLRGPQGTLYGRNATGGAINIVSNAPSHEFSGETTVGVGNFGRTDFETVVSGPLARNLLGRLGGFCHERWDGFGKNLATGNDVDTLHECGGKAALQWTPIDKLELLARMDYYHANDSNGLFHYVGAVNQPFPGAPTLPQLFGANPTPSNVRDIDSAADPNRYANIWGSSLDASYALNDSFTVKSITGYRRTVSSYLTALDNSPLPIYGPFTLAADSHQISQEMQLHWQTDRFYSVFGAYYFDELTRSRLFIDSYLNTGIPSVGIPKIFPSPYGVFTQQATLDTTAKAVFGNADWKVTDSLHLGVGLRYSEESKHNQGFQIAFFPAPIHDVDQGRRSHGVTPQFTALYNLTDNVNLYGNISRGFKSGEFLSGTPQYALPEFVWSYEGGVKGSLLNGMLSGSADAFYYDYTDLQVERDASPFIFFDNVPKGILKGIETEGRVRLPMGFQLDGNITFLRSDLKSFITQNPDLPGHPTVNLNGNRFPYAPKTTINLGLQRTFGFASFGEGVLRADFQHVTDTFEDVFNTTNTNFRPAYSLWNASYKQTFSNHWSVLLWGKNLANKLVYLNTSTSAPPNLIVPTLPSVKVPPYPVASLEEANLNEPRTYGISVQYKW
ncbi:MAG: iron complex outerrane recepter protein [Gammaproteobacteria bacterium]|jgi:iron complex outermembrane receptor protein|nr:iron complex outerrane recepter protein [Gammaproteobacteria bacterium]